MSLFDYQRETDGTLFCHSQENDLLLVGSDYEVEEIEEI